MKITDLKMYGVGKKTFITEIEQYDVSDSDEIIKEKILMLLRGLISVIGFDAKMIDAQEDMEIVELKRFDNEGTIFCTINVKNLS